MANKKTIIVGASPNKSRYAHAASVKLKNYGYPIIPLGIREGEAGGEKILNIYDEPEIKEVDTISLYLSPEKQPPWYDYLLGLSPKRIIFNPGAENPELANLARDRNIEVVEACTLLMLSTGAY